MRFLFFAALWAAVAGMQAQHSIQIRVQDAVTHEPLTDATCAFRQLGTGANADDSGLAIIANLPAGTYRLSVSYPDYSPFSTEITFPQSSDRVFVVQLEPASTGEIVIASTRSNRSIADSPTRIEVLTEEIDEISTHDPGRISHLLTHSTGIQVQTTSATSSSANVRIQGLDGRYAQLLRDGFPLYGGLSGSLSIMQVPPLDLGQVEYIKGPASTLYGGGAISGIINLLSKEPTDDGVTLHLNGASIGVLDLSAFATRRTERVGLTVLASRNYQQAYNPDGDAYTDAPLQRRNTLNPRVFLYLSPRTKLMLGATFTDEARTGGDLLLVNGKQQPDSLHFYLEDNTSRRITTQAKLDHKVGSWTLTARNGLNLFQRTLNTRFAPGATAYRFSGDQLSSFSELSALWVPNIRHSLVTGVNLYTDHFQESPQALDTARTENRTVVGAFTQHTWRATQWFSLESGLRTDHVLDAGSYLLPRISGLFRWSSQWVTRVGGGLGYRLPTMFNQEAELLGYRGVQQVNVSNTNAERSTGVNADLGYRSELGTWGLLSINVLGFYNRVENSLALLPDSVNSGLRYRNLDGYMDSQGCETQVKFTFGKFTLFAGYTYTEARQHYASLTGRFPLTPTHSLKGDLLFIAQGKWRIVADYEIKSGQVLGSGRVARGYASGGLVVERTIGPVRLYFNIENVLDVRQSRFESLRSGPNDTPQFTEVWAPLEGIVLNGGVIVRL